MDTVNFSDPRIRSGLNFVVFLVIAVAVALFILNKAKAAIAEIERLSELPAVADPRNYQNGAVDDRIK